jgi:predicted DNA-binding transcriptional regulator AlpA
MRFIDGRQLTAKFAKANIQPQSREHRWRMIRAGEFPVPVRIGAKNYWVEEEINAWHAARVAAALAARDATAAYSPSRSCSATTCPSSSRRWRKISTWPADI